MPCVSAIIPVFNGAAFISEAVTSALEQTHTNMEIIVVDDGSTDNTPELLAEFGDQIRVIRQANTGHVVARNNAAKVAKGEWLAFLDADDIWFPKKIEKQLAIVNACNEGLVYTDRENFGHITRVKKRLSDAMPLFEGDVYEKLLEGNFITVSSVMIRKDWFERLGGFDPELKVCEDWDLWLRYSEIGGLTRLCPEPLMRYRWHLTSMSHNFEKMLEGRLRVIRKTLQSPRGKGASKSIANRAIANAWKASAWTAAETNPRKAVGWYCRSAWIWPWDAEVFKEILKCCIGKG